MNEDLKKIKKKYGEKMMHLCRELFPTILEEKGLLTQIFEENFDENRNLYDDIINNCLKYSFKSFIYNKANLNDENIKADKDPEELLNQAGYDLYECKTEEEIQSFKKYYALDEAICTFQGGRLNRCYVFFAVKKNVDEIKRENFEKPQRQDEYGTSVISIQFTKDNYNTLSIKNRYNHTVDNPDATFANNLDNIIPGLTDAFGKKYGLKQTNKDEEFAIPNYIKAKDGKFYRYNFTIDGIYYCQNNVIIDNGNVKKYSKENYLIFENYILDLQNKKITNYDPLSYDGFVDTLNDIQKIDIKKENDNKKIIIELKDRIVEVILNKQNRIIGLTDENIKIVPNNYLENAKCVKHISMQNVIEIGHNFLKENRELTEIDFPNLQKVGNYFIYYNKILNNINLPNLQASGDMFLGFNNEIKEAKFPNLIYAGESFLQSDKKLRNINIPKLTEIKGNFLGQNEELTQLYAPCLQDAGYNFIKSNQKIREVYLPNLTKVGSDFLFQNREIRNIDFPNLSDFGSGFLYCNVVLESINLPKLSSVPYQFMQKLLNKEQEIQVNSKYKIIKDDYRFVLAVINTNKNIEEKPKQV